MSDNSKKWSLKYWILIGEVAQLVERSPEEAGVGGSSPSFTTQDGKSTDTRREQSPRFVTEANYGRSSMVEYRSPKPQMGVRVLSPVPRNFCTFLGYIE